ncbi:polyprenol reductase 2-like isoform X2 [Malania oleifera]|uniref:polyprenol reductase 2-like isoform X2 n=1 Tax=Malania oleifera TaxID=397392 RepID=UPI0025AE9B20|nr:polyprenol reductase 2-like isoform X2 [Malania oleifera]
MDFPRLVGLLRLAWVAGTLPILIALMPSYGLSSFREVLLGFAKRGKTMQSSSHRFTVPQKFFLHFYVVAVVWTTFLVLVTSFYAYKMVPLVSEPLDYSTIASELAGGSHISSLYESQSIRGKLINSVWQSLFLLLLMEVQVLRRLYESIFVLNYSPSARMHISGYLTGMFFYIAAPLSLCSIWLPAVFEYAADVVAEFIVRGKNQMPAVEFDWWGYLNPLMKLGWRQWIGAAIFFWGWIHQLRCHAILVIYAGLVVASGGTDLTVWLLFEFVVANLAFAAAETHRWYLHKFDNYPRGRFAIIPFVY